MAASASSKLPNIPQADLDSFAEHLQKSKRILAVLGAGLSASSGLPTFRGAGGLWRQHDATQLATPEAFEADPGLVWQFYSYRRHMALNVNPNPAHFALAELARKRDGFLTISQNVDGLSQRANHPRDKLHLLHGSLYDVRCTSFYCRHVETNNFTDPIVPALAIPTEDDAVATSAFQAREREHQQHGASTSINGGPRELDISDIDVALPDLPVDALPHCPKCHNGLLRPGVVWFGEMLPGATLDTINDWIEAGPIDLCMVIGTSSKVYPAAGYAMEARVKGARVAVINIDKGDEPGGGLMQGDWFFQGDAAVVVPEILKSVIGEIGQEGRMVGQSNI
ncbi:NAD-dependent deacetylase sirtuin-5 [Rhizodiscina lignyota]|uniref:NAD-dependent deacetylase sirtuin-5 n=1 Tax=Rhizodiscina lignyota TaxID=1504668 RepID=A0A9P4IEQ3_9PEZI|nr:NAD-dependent deacetylase sirtuin-5 [Rhizodiscina lignyota]